MMGDKPTYLPHFKPVLGTPQPRVGAQLPANLPNKYSDAASGNYCAPLGA